MGLAVLSGVCVFKSGLSTPIRVSLIVVPDKFHTTLNICMFQRGIYTVKNTDICFDMKIYTNLADGRINE